MDEQKQQAFVQMVRERGGDTDEVAVSVEEFFDGNDDATSIAAGHAHSPSLTTIRRVLDGLRTHPGVHEVYLEVEKLRWPEYPAGKWPYAHRAHVITTLDPPQVDELAADSDPAPASAVEPDGAAPGHDAPPGFRYIEVGWD